MIPTYITTPTPATPKSSVTIIQEFCHEIEPKPIYCELPDDLGKSRSQLPQPSTYTSVSFSGTASGASTTTLPLGLQYEIRK